MVTYTTMGILWLSSDYQELQTVSHINIETFDTTLPCTVPHAKFAYPPREVNTQKSNLDYILQSGN